MTCVVMKKFSEDECEVMSCDEVDVKIFFEDEKLFKKKQFCEKLFVHHRELMSTTASCDDVEEKFFKMR